MSIDQLLINKQQRQTYEAALAQLQLARDTREALGYQLSEINRLTREAATYPNRNPENNVLAFNTAVDALVNHVILINENIPPMDRFMREFVHASSNCQALLRDRERLRHYRNQLGHQRYVAAHPNTITEGGRVALDITGTPISHVIADLKRVINQYDSYGSRGRVLPERQEHQAFKYMPPPRP